MDQSIGSQSEPNPSNVWDLMAKMGGVSDPRMQAVMEFLKQREQLRPSDSSPEQPGRLKEVLAKLEQLLQRVDQFEQENQILRGRLRLLSSALGACECWGAEGISCPICNGQGTPGSFVPDRGAFMAYVLPAVRAMPKARPRAAEQIPSKEQTPQEGQQNARGDKLEQKGT